VKNWLLTVTRLKLAAWAGILFIAMGVALVALVSHYIPRDGVIENLRASQPVMENFKRADSFTECLIFGTAILDPGLTQDVFGFQKLAKVDEPCPALAEYLASDKPDSIDTTTYLRYWNGPAVLARAFLSVMNYLGVYVLYACLSLAAFVLWGVALAKQGVDRKLAAACTLLVLWSGGFVFFGGNVAHAPAFFLPLFLLGYATLSSRWWENDLAGVFIAASLGALTLWLDMLFEAVPFNALFLGLTVLLLAQGPALRRVILMLAAYGYGVFIMILFKFAVIIAISGSLDSLRAEYLEPLQYRMGWGGEANNINYGDLVLHLLPTSAEKIFGTPLVFWAYMAVSAVAFIFAILKKRANLWGYALLMLVVPVWYALFLEHSWVHSGFSTQLLFWPGALGLIALAQGDKAFKIQKS
jgi:hypothetical protein